MSKQDVDREIKKALSVWSDFTDLTFTQRSSGRVHIDISFLDGIILTDKYFSVQDQILQFFLQVNMEMGILLMVLAELWHMRFFPFLEETLILMIVSSGLKILSEVSLFVILV